MASLAIREHLSKTIRESNGYLAVLAFITNLPYNYTLPPELDDNHRALEQEVYSALCDVLESQTPALTSLTVQLRCDSKRLNEALSTYPHLLRLLDESNCFRPEQISHLAAMLRANTSITHLYLFGNALGPAGGNELARALEHNSTVTDLNLGMNNLDSTCGPTLGNMLKVNRGLKTIQLGDNKLGSEGAEFIAAALLYYNTTLTSLELNYNDIDTQTSATMLLMNQSLTSVNLAANHSLMTKDIGDISSGLSFATALRQNRGLCSLTLSSTNLHSKNARELADALQANTTLAHLAVSYNPTVDKSGAAAFLRLFKMNRSLSVEMEAISRDRDHPVHKGYAEAAKALSEQNRARQRRLRLNWGGVALLTAFIRANEDNALRHSILALAPSIIKSADDGPG